MPAHPIKALRIQALLLAAGGWRLSSRVVERLAGRLLGIGEIAIAWVTRDPLRTLLFFCSLTLWVRVYGPCAAQWMVGLSEWAATGSVAHPEAYSRIPSWSWQILPRATFLGPAAPVLRSWFADCAQITFVLVFARLGAVAAQSLSDALRQGRDLWIRARDADRAL